MLVDFDDNKYLPNAMNVDIGLKKNISHIE